MPSYQHGTVDPFTNGGGSSFTNFAHAVAATAIFRCWHILLFFSGWATMVTLVSRYVHSLVIQPTLLTVIGTVLGFVISYRTTSSFERYNEGRRLWSQIILASRTFARLVWFHVPEVPGEGDFAPAEKTARVLVEKMTVINLLQAFATSVKHYLRGEEGIFYEDLFHLVKFLPPYALPAGFPATDRVDGAQSPAAPGGAESPDPTDPDDTFKTLHVSTSHPNLPFGTSSSSQHTAAASLPHLPLAGSPVTPSKRRGPGAATAPAPPMSPRSARFSISAGAQRGMDREKSAGWEGDDASLYPARMPPRFALFDLFPFSLLVRGLQRRGMAVSGKKAARMRARESERDGTVSHNIPLEVSLYLSAYIAALQKRKALDPPTATNLLATLTQLVDALTGLERILTTPIPFSYSIHLWVVTIIYCLALPFQIYATLKWLTIPATAIASFIFFGFLVAGEEIENPFGYDKNDLNMDHFCHNIIRNELRAITSTPAPDVSLWAFSPANDRLFASIHGHNTGHAVAHTIATAAVPGAATPLGTGTAPRHHLAPEDWVTRGPQAMLAALAV